MRHRLLIGTGLLVAASPAIAPANLLTSLNPKAVLSHLSVQVCDQPRSAAGRRKNVWDADPPEAANAGVHYFLYDQGPEGTLLPQGQRPMSFRSIAGGPGYDVLCQILVQSPSYSGGQPFFLGIPTSTDYDNPENSYDPVANGFQELGVVRIQFTTNSSSPARGSIGGQTDSAEDAYDGATVNGQFVRGVEQARVFTSTVAGHDDDTLRGTMSATIPAGYLPDYPTMAFDAGYLAFNEGTSSGDDVLPAGVTIPEPGTVSVLASAGLLALRRRRTG